MKNLISQLKQLKNSVHMNSTERDAMRESLQEYISMHPIREHAYQRKLNIRHVLANILTHKAVPAMLVLVMLTGSGAGIAYASESALPDEPLYEVKELIEEVRAKILVTDQAKAQWAERRVQRRIDEAQQMLELGRLTDTQVQRIDMRIKKQKKIAKRILIKLEKAKPQKAAQLRIALLKHEDITIKNLKKRTVDKELLQIMREIDKLYAESERSVLQLQQSIVALEEIIHN